MASSFIVTGAKYDELEAKYKELEAKNIELERKNAELEKENSLFKEELEKMKEENKTLETKVNSTVFSVDKSDVEKTKDELVAKAKGTMNEYLKKLSE